eukprot:1294541-Amphidinium_carterae.1
MTHEANKILRIFPKYLGHRVAVDFGSTLVPVVLLTGSKSATRYGRTGALLLDQRLTQVNTPTLTSELLGTHVEPAVDGFRESCH